MALTSTSACKTLEYTGHCTDLCMCVCVCVGGGGGRVRQSFTFPNTCTNDSLIPWLRSTLHCLCSRGESLASFPGPLREFHTASDEHAGPGNEARESLLE